MPDTNSKDNGIDWDLIDFERPLSETEKIVIRLLALLVVAIVATTAAIALNIR